MPVIPIALVLEGIAELMAGIRRAREAGQQHIEAEEVARFTERMQRESALRSEWDQGRQGGPRNQPAGPSQAELDVREGLNRETAAAQAGEPEGPDVAPPPGE